MCLLVVHDLARLPRTSAVVQGLSADRPWDEAHLQRAITYTLLQTIYRVLWVGLHIKGEPPEVNPYPIPKPGGAQDAQESGPRKPDPRKQAYLERFAPPSRRKHLTVVKNPPTGGEQTTA